MGCTRYSLRSGEAVQQIYIPTPLVNITSARHHTRNDRAVTQDPIYYALASEDPRRQGKQPRINHLPASADVLVVPPRRKAYQKL
jgi:hypothetical protein